MDDFPFLGASIWVPKVDVPCSTDPDAWTEGKVYGRNSLNLQFALSICFTKCPVREECLESAREQELGVGMNHRFGIRGGTTPDQRYAMDKTTRGYRKRMKEETHG